MRDLKVLPVTVGTGAVRVDLPSGTQALAIQSDGTAVLQLSDASAGAYWTIGKTQNTPLQFATEGPRSFWLKANTTGTAKILCLIDI